MKFYASREKALELLENFINKDIRLDPIVIDKNKDTNDIVSYYMGKNTQDRQNFIINNLKYEESI